MTPEQTKLLILALDFSISRIDGDIAQEMAELLEQLENTMSEPTAIEEIRKALEAGPTPGTWTAKDSRGAGLEIYVDIGSQYKDTPHQWPSFSTANADVKKDLIAYETWMQFPKEKLTNIQARNAVYIAACNPANMQELLDHLSVLQAENERLSDALRDIDWRIDDIRQDLMGGGRGHSVYGIDEWSTPSVNLATARKCIANALAPKPPAPELFAGVNAALANLTIRNTQEPQK